MFKKITFSAIAIALGFSMGWSVEKNVQVMEASSVMKALPIYSNTLIDKAPEGKTVIGARDCFSYYYLGGDHIRKELDGVVGEYIVGDDGNIYLRAVCYEAAQISSNTDTYLKLEKVDDETYVAHTPQLIWVDNTNDGNPFVAYATRVVFSQKSATSFGYEVQQLPNGDYDTDIYFTVKDGMLQQKNMDTTEMNEEVFPQELIGFTSSTGNWIGFGDGCLRIYTPEQEPTSLPEGAEVIEKSLDYNLLHVRDVVLDNAALLKYAEVGDDLYLSNPSASSDQWIKGSIDRKENTVTFKPQYLGLDAESKYAVWFIPVSYDKYIELFDEETGFGDWFRSYEAIESLVFDYQDGNLSMATPGQAILFSHSAEKILPTGVFADASVKEFESASMKPAPVKFTKYEPMDDLWGFGVIGFAIPSMSEDGIYIPSDELFYNVFPDDSTTPFVFSSKDYQDMVVAPMTDVPYGYFEDFDFKVSGVNHTVYFYHEWKKVGVQVIQKHDGVETRSEIVYSDNSNGVDAIETNVQKDAPGVYKMFKDGKVVIVRDGDCYDILGVPVKL